MKHNIKLQSDERGLVSIIVTLVLIIVMTLVVLAMSQNANREQRQSLDRQLSDQAFYNAESGINDWANYLYETPNADPDKKDCNTTGNVSGKPFPVADIGTDGTNSYTCILYDKAPLTIEFDNLSVSDSNVVPIDPSNGTLNNLIFTWRAKEGTTSTGGCPVNYTILPQGLGAGCNVGGLRIDLVNPAGDRAAINNNNFAAYLLPSRSGSATLGYTTGTVNQGQIGQARCNANDCTLTITGLNIPAAATRYYLHVKGLYQASDLSISGTGGAATPIKFENAQIMIDATGKASDVLRRVQVRLPAQSQYDYPGSFSLKTTQNICKLMTVTSDGRATSTADCPQ